MSKQNMIDDGKRNNGRMKNLLIYPHTEKCAPMELGRFI
jgi:hypothetical protein